MNLPTAGGQAHLYFLQVDQSTSGTHEKQVIPLCASQNNLEYDNEECLLPMLQAEQGFRQGQWQFLIDIQQESVKIQENNQIKKRTNHNIPKTLSHYPSVNTLYNSTLEDKTTKLEQVSETSKSQPRNQVQDDNSSNNDKKHNIQNYVHIFDRSVPPRAVAVLPAALQIRRRDNVSPRRPLPARVRFGPLQGVRQTISRSKAHALASQAAALKTPLFLLNNDDGDNVTLIDVSDKDKSNWLGLLPLGDQSTANVWLYQESDQLYAVTTESIAPRKPLKLGYSKKYSDGFELPLGQPFIDLEAEFSVRLKKWWCTECHRAMASAAVLQRHIDVYHKEENLNPRRRYRCRQCSRTFSRLYTLKRHLAHHCSKKVEKSAHTNIAKPNPRSSNDLNTEDNRIPSDESFQNFSNALDFSTNLFDTDRIPSLDISVHSKNESEFNPYYIGYREENGLTNDLGFPKLSNGPESSQSSENKQPQSSEPLLATCPYCNQVVVREQKRKHLRACPSRRFECECGTVFTNKKKLAQHVFSDHPTDLTSKTSPKSSMTLNDMKSYKCEQCQHSFKRRGMLVNHLWRIHKSVPAAVPVQRRVRHYPCVACPKIYRTAAKRDRHVRLHHPGSEKVRAQSIEGGVRACEPAACAACPRQYATRAKLLQHVRLHHPHLAQPSNKKPFKSEIGDVNIPTVKLESQNKSIPGLKQILGFY